MAFVQSKFTDASGGTSSDATFTSTLTAGNLMLDLPFKGGPDTWSTDPRVAVSCSIDPAMTKFGVAQTNFYGSSGLNVVAMLGKIVSSGDTYSGPFGTYQACTGGSASHLLMEFSGFTGGAFTYDVLTHEGFDSSPVDLGTFTGVGATDVIVMALVKKRDGYGGSPDPTVVYAPAGFTQLVDGYFLVNGWVWVGYKIGPDSGSSASASVSYTSDGFGGWAAMAIHVKDSAGGESVTCDFSATPTSGGIPLSVAFTDLSTGTPDTWAWDFGDGGTSTSQNPTHNYTVAGSYDVTFTATRSSDADNCTKTVTAFVVVTAVHAGVLIDWDNNGFGLGTADEVSGSPQNVVSWVINRGAGAEITGGAQPGSCTLILKNPADIYNPRNAGGALFGKLRDGPPVWVGPNSDGKLTGTSPRGLFGGRITDISLLPSGGATVSPLVEITCEDALSWYQRTPVQLDYAEGRSHGELREAALVAAGETRYDLAHEITTMPLSHADGSLGTTLDNINSINGTRHLAKPSDLYTDWFRYTTRNRQWRLDATVDASVDAGSEHVTDTSGWRLSADTVINQQKATVTPITFTPSTFTVWEADKLPIGVTDVRPFSRIVDFDDVVRDPVLDLTYSGDAITSTITLFGTAAKVELTVAAGNAATVSRLSIEGRLARRLPDESHVADDLVSQAAPRGIRAGGEIGNEYLGVIASARGIAEHVVYRYGNPQLRPTLTIHNWFPEQFDLDLFDVIAFTSAELDMTDQLFEIVGLTHESDVASATVQHHVVTYVLQESRVQSTYPWFYLDSGPNSSVLDGAFHLAY